MRSHAITTKVRTRNPVSPFVEGLFPFPWQSKPNSVSGPYPQFFTVRPKEATVPTLDKNKGSKSVWVLSRCSVTPQLLITYCVPGCVVGAGDPAVQ